MIDCIGNFLESYVSSARWANMPHVASGADAHASADGDTAVLVHTGAGFSRLIHRRLACMHC